MGNEANVFQHQAEIWWPVPGWQPADVDTSSLHPEDNPAKLQPLHEMITMQISLEHGKINEAIKAMLRSKPEVFVEKVIFGLRMVFEELFTNALKHGHGADPNKKLVIRWGIDQNSLRVQLTDEGPGFDIDKALAYDPIAPENIEKPMKRGLMLIRHYTSRVEWQRPGNVVTFEKTLEEQVEGQ